MTEQAPQAFYAEDLGDGMRFQAFSLDPSINNDGLLGIVKDLASKPKVSQEKKDAISRKGSVRHIGNLELEIARNADGTVKQYQVPVPLRDYREAIGEAWTKSGKFNGPILIVDGELRNPLRVMQGGYFDFAATKLESRPSDLAPVCYEPGKTVGQILADAGLGPESRARYFGIAHLMWPDNGKEILMVQRAKGMGIAADCLATPGSTPDLVLSKPGLGKPGSGVREYWSYHITEEMRDEFGLNFGDFWVDQTRLYEDAISVPFGAMNIHTEMPIGEIARGIYNAKPAVRDRVLKEHNVIFGVPVEAIPKFLEKFPVFYSLYTPIRDALKERGISE